MARVEITRDGTGRHRAGHTWTLRVDGRYAGTYETRRQALAAAPPPPTCTAVIPAKGICGRPATGRLEIGNGPVCGVHLRAAVQRGEGTRPLNP